MPRKVRELLKDLASAGFIEIVGSGKGSHRKYTENLSDLSINRAYSPIPVNEIQMTT